MGPVDRGDPSTVVARRGTGSFWIGAERRRARLELMMLSWEPESSRMRTAVEELGVRRLAERMIRFSSSGPGSRQESMTLLEDKEREVREAGRPELEDELESA